MTETYIGQILSHVNVVTARCGPVLLFGENIDTGSRIAGLARGLTVNPAGSIRNVGNCELTHCGVGFGMLLDGAQSVLFVKQLDFMLLALDQITNTYNFIRAFRPLETQGSFTIFSIVCDQGYQGPQSSFNGAGDFASMANVNAFCLNGVEDVAAVVAGEFVSPGFRIICLSQRLFGAAALREPVEYQSPDRSIFRYRSGDDLTIACYNFALRDGLELADALQAAGVRADVFHLNYVPSMDTTIVEQSAMKTSRLVVLDDSKSVAKFGDRLVTSLASRRAPVSVLSLGRRGTPVAEYGCIEDRFRPDHAAILDFVRQR